ncbi:hypothetical protein AERO_17475, partial [Aeromicrobium fastidiosum]|uniref:hypothetical protein n=1 Tax=Aeromicrobium fastidiosum TaxID=52699 RepID=UPI0035AC266D|nr:hypothetical protein [Aeromicrobium fastidiosum]
MSTGETGPGSEQEMLPIGPDAPAQTPPSTAADEELTQPTRLTAGPVEPERTPPAEPSNRPEPTPCLLYTSDAADEARR